jgi:hypothetical protein
MGERLKADVVSRPKFAAQAATARQGRVVGKLSREKIRLCATQLWFAKRETNCNCQTATVRYGRPLVRCLTSALPT